MKKLVLAMICILLLVVFIAFNYLLWERQGWEKDIENFKNLNVESNSKANSFEKQNSELYQDIEKLKGTIDELMREKDRIENEKNRMEAQVKELDLKLSEKALMVSQLKSIADINVLEEPVKKWVEAINKGLYADAFNLMRSNEPEDPIERGNILNDFIDSYKNNIKSIVIKDLKVKEDAVGARGGGEIIIEVSLDVARVEGQENGTGPLKQGINKRNFYLGCDVEVGRWIITNITYAY